MDCPVNPYLLCSGDNVENNAFSYNNGVNTSGEFRELARMQHTTPQPHFKPGYTGYTPGTVDKSTGLTYGHYTNNLLRDHRVAGNRLSRIPGDCCLNLKQYPPTIPKDNPHKTLEPHFLPGYTGFTPGSGIRRSEGIGETYGRMTHVKLAKHFLKGGRLRSLYQYPAECVAKEEDVKFYCYEHELTGNDIKRRVGMLPGYAGHIPRALFRHGKNGTKIAEESIAEFQQIINK